MPVSLYSIRIYPEARYTCTWLFLFKAIALYGLRFTVATICELVEIYSIGLRSICLNTVTVPHSSIVYSTSIKTLNMHVVYMYTYIIDEPNSQAGIYIACLHGVYTYTCKCY